MSNVETHNSLSLKNAVLRLRVYVERSKAATACALYSVANNILTDAKRRCPVEEGTLRGSGYATLPKTRDTNPHVEIGFGGYAADYAVAVHEDPSKRHPVGEYKFLTNAVDAARSTMLSDINAIARQYLLGGGVPSPTATEQTTPWSGPQPSTKTKARKRKVQK